MYQLMNAAVYKRPNALCITIHLFFPRASHVLKGIAPNRSHRMNAHIDYTKVHGQKYFNYFDISFIPLAIQDWIILLDLDLVSIQIGCS